MAKRGLRSDQATDDADRSADERERVQVKTTIPAYQKHAWREEADDLGMSLSEFVRSMVQAGRRGFESPRSGRPESDATPGVEAVEKTILDILDERALSAERLRRETLGALENQVDDACERLEHNNRIEYFAKDDVFVRRG